MSTGFGYYAKLLAMSDKKIKCNKRGVYVDPDECIGCELCAQNCPGVFVMNEEKDVSEVVDAGGATEEEVQEAIDDCPVGAIHWEK